MPDRIRIRIFLSSPGDVAAERQIVREVLAALNTSPLVRDEVEIEDLAWEAPESRVLMPVTLTPQEAIDAGLAKPSETDAVLVIFWGRMGTPLDTERHGTKSDGDPYWSGTEWEYLDAVEGASKHPYKLPIVLVYRRTDATIPPQQKDFTTIKQYIEALEQYTIQLKRVEAFFEQFRDPVTDAFKGNVFEYDSLEVFRERVEEDAQLIVKEIRRKRTDGTSKEGGEPTARRITWHGSPFPGLRPFTEKDEPIFFGRGRESADLIKRVGTQRLMFVVGASGSGKSSLVAAGVIPQLKRGAIPGVPGWHIVRCTPGDRPFRRLAVALLFAVPALKDPIADDEERADQLADVLRKGPDKLAQQVTKWLADEPEGAEVLLFIDQFEELYTTSEAGERATFIAMLKVSSPQIRVIATLRSDFYDRALHNFEITLRDATFTLGTPSALALYEIIQRPADVTGLCFDVELVEEIVEKTTGQVGGLALMAYLLEELYEQSAKRRDQRLTWNDYNALGGVEKVIASRAAQVYEQLDWSEKRKRTALQRVFRELVEPTIRDGEVIVTRRRADLASLQTDADNRVFIDAFQQARLLVTHEGIVEVAHEALLREWGELADRIAEIAEDLRLLRRVEREAVDWDRSYILSPERLKPIHKAIKRLGYILSPIARDFVYPQRMLLHELGQAKTVEKRRLRIGDDLDLLGDPRDGIGVKKSVPDMIWLPVEVSWQPVAIKTSEIEIGPLIIGPFFIAKYLVTYVQYQAFVEADDGFKNPDWWQSFPDKYRPQELSDQRTKNANNPRDSVSWYQSVAFARWLNHKLRGIELTHPSRGVLRVGDNAEIRLPTEWEWQWAAQGGFEVREYPWGTWKPGCANTSESGLGRAIAVGMYPQGAAKCGALDMSGNLREWCLNDRENPEVVNGYSNNYSKVLRGGAFSGVKLSSAASSRGDYAYAPSRRSHSYGFRLVVG